MQTLPFFLLMMAPSAPGTNPFVGFLPIVAMLAILYFLLLRPQQKEAKRHQEMLRALKKGDDVVTAGGLFGRILSLNEERVSLRVDEGVKVEVERSKILRLVERTGGRPAGEPERSEGAGRKA
ncbi:MAG: preprotein translocase subunit YajC [Gemmatimonadota bacterium]